MQMKKFWWSVILLVSAGVIATYSSAGPVLAVTTNSNNYQVTEMQFGSGGTLESCSDEYCSQASIGDMTDGVESTSKSTASFSPTTSTDPFLEVIVDKGVSDLGKLTTEKTATKTMIVRVQNYLSGGYIMQVVGDAPKYDDHSLKTSGSPAQSKPGTEQFGLNAVANSVPSFGADPVHMPNEEVNLSLIEPNYRTPDRFMYRSGDVIARNKNPSGRTDYTISMVVNISNSTPAGHYAGDYAVIVTPVY